MHLNKKIQIVYLLKNIHYYVFIYFINMFIIHKGKNISIANQLNIAYLHQFMTKISPKTQKIFVSFEIYDNLFNLYLIN